MDSFSGSFLIASAPTVLVALVCAVAAGLAFVRHAELGSAAAVAGVGFAGLAVASALHAGMLYMQFSASAHNVPIMQIARAIGTLGFGATISQIAGVILVAIAMFQKRPACGQGPRDERRVVSVD